MDILSPYTPNRTEIEPRTYVQSQIYNADSATQHKRRGVSYYFDSHDEVAYPSAKKTLEPIDWENWIDDYKPPEPVPEELHDYNRLIGEHGHDIITHGGTAKPTQINPHTLPIGISYKHVLETLAETHTEMEPLDEVDKELITDETSAHRIQDQTYWDIRAAKDLWKEACNELNIDVLETEPKLIHEIEDGFGFGCEPDSITSANPPTAEAGLYSTELKISARQITAANKCQAEMQRRAIQPIIDTDAEVHAMVVRIDPLNREYEYETTSDDWQSDIYRDRFDHRLRYRYREGLDTLMNEVVREHSQR